MWLFLAGLVLLGAILALFWLKGRIYAPWVHRLCYHELTARLTVVALAFIFVGGLISLADILAFLGIELPEPGVSQNKPDR